jgi:hypothetical protein
MIHDSIFINNNVSKIIYASGEVAANDNWFGNNATNYNETPNVGIGLDNWLFLNATANPDEPLVNQSSSIAFKLCSYNATSGTIRDYDASEMNVELELNSTLGELNQYSALIGEEVTYSSKQPGNAEVMGKFETASYAIGLNVDSRNPTVIDVVNSTVDLKVNDEVGAGASLTPADAGNLTYNSSNPSVATVDKNGKVTALKNGTTTITCKSANGKTAKCTVTVRKVVVTDIQLDKRSVLVDAGVSFNIIATITPGNATNKTVKWTTSDSGVAKVSSSGKVTAVASGVCQITATTADGGYTAVCMITVK